MGIKPDAEILHFAKFPQERALAAELDEAFIITHGQRIGELSFWFAEAKERSKDRFGLIQEVLVIYSPHQKTDARVLTTIENVSRFPEFKHRIDKVVSILIHNGSPDETSQLIRQHPDRIIVPFTVSDLLAKSKPTTFLRSRIAAAIGETDLYGMSSPLRDQCKTVISPDNLLAQMTAAARS